MGNIIMFILGMILGGIITTALMDRNRKELLAKIRRLVKSYDDLNKDYSSYVAMMTPVLKDYRRLKSLLFQQRTSPAIDVEYSSQGARN